MESNDGTKGSLSRGSDNSATTTKDRRVGLIYDERMCRHYAPYEGDHPECPDRIRVVWERLSSSGLAKRCTVLNAKSVNDTHIALVHTEKHINLIKNVITRNTQSRRRRIASSYDSIYFSEGSSEAAYLAAGSVIEVAEKVAEGKLDSSFAIVRPPGHHAEMDEPMGFCLFNNVAIAASFLLNERRDLGINKILIVDWDVHHGNGTQKMFYNDSRVLFFSVHRHDFGMFYPTGDDGSYIMIGEGPGTGYNINVPWESGRCGDVDYLAVWDHILIPVAKEFNPDMILISAGFDAAIRDPLGGCCVTPYGYSIMLEKLMVFARGKIVMALEGGYNLDSLANSVEACVGVLLGDSPVLGSLEAHPFKSTWRVIQEGQELRTHWPILASRLPDNVISKRSPQIDVSNRCKELNLVLHWNKSHSMVTEGIMLGHNISENRIEVDRVKVDVQVKDELLVGDSLVKEESGSSKDERLKGLDKEVRKKMEEEGPKQNRKEEERKLRDGDQLEEILREKEKLQVIQEERERKIKDKKEEERKGRGEEEREKEREEQEAKRRAEEAREEEARGIRKEEERKRREEEKQLEETLRRDNEKLQKIQEEREREWKEKEKREKKEEEERKMREQERERNEREELEARNRAKVKEEEAQRSREEERKKREEEKQQLEETLRRENETLQKIQEERERKRKEKKEDQERKKREREERKHEQREQKERERKEQEEQKVRKRADAAENSREEETQSLEEERVKAKDEQRRKEAQEAGQREKDQVQPQSDILPSLGLNIDAYIEVGRQEEQPDFATDDGRNELLNLRNEVVNLKQDVVDLQASYARLESRLNFVVQVLCNVFCQDPLPS